MMIMRTVCVSVLMAVAASGQEASVKPGVNEKFLDPELKVGNGRNGLRRRVGRFTGSVRRL